MNDLNIKLSSVLDEQRLQKQEHVISDLKKVNEDDMCSINKQLNDGLKNTNEGLIILNDQLKFVYLNEFAKVLLRFINLDDLLGVELSTVFPPKSLLYQKIFNAHVNQVPVHFEYHPIDGRQFLEIDVFPHREGVMVYLHDLIYRKFFKKGQYHEKIIDVMDKITEGFLILDCSWKFIYLNNEAEGFFAQFSGRLLGKEIWSEFPQIKGSEIEEKYKRSMEDQLFLCFETKSFVSEKWYEQQVFLKWLGCQDKKFLNYNEQVCIS